MTSLPRAPAPATLRQLDELEALVQRMLDLPVFPAEEPQPKPTTAAEPDSPLSPASLLPTSLAEPVPVAPVGAEEPSPPPVPADFSLPSPEALAPAPRMFAVPIPVSPPEGLPRWCLPLVWINRGFDRGTGWFGPLGRGLRSRYGRILLGWIGVGLLATAAAWAVCDATSREPEPAAAAGGVPSGLDPPR